MNMNSQPKNQSKSLELFDMESVKQDSPKLAWIKKHNAVAYKSRGSGDEPDWMPWCAWLPDNEECGIPVDPEKCGYGHTEEEALRDLGVVNNITLWNEES